MSKNKTSKRGVDRGRFPSETITFYKQEGVDLDLSRFQRLVFWVQRSRLGTWYNLRRYGKKYELQHITTVGNSLKAKETQL